MKGIFRVLLFFLTISCGDIKNYNINDGNLNSYFTRKFGSIGYDYGWSLDYSPFDNGIIITGSQEKEIGGELQKRILVIGAVCEKKVSFFEKKFSQMQKNYPD